MGVFGKYRISVYFERSLQELSLATSEIQQALIFLNIIFSVLHEETPQ